MSRQQAFEAIYAKQHDIPAESLVQYRFESKDGYSLPGIASHYRFYCLAMDSEEIQELRKDRTDWQSECLKRGFEYVREPDDHYVLADLPEMADLLGVLLGVEVRSKDNDSYGETVSALKDAVDSNSDAFHRAYEAEKECKSLRKALVDVRESVQREYWDEYAGMEETRAILDAAMSKGERP